MFKTILLSCCAAMIMLAACENPGSANTSGDTIVQNTIKPTNKTIKDTARKSIPATASRRVNGNLLTVNYHSPAVRGRIIWGGLVPYDQVWVTGAHMATSLEVQKDFKMGGKKIPAGKYALFTIPGQQEWIVILNKNWEQHLADEYDAAQDVVRMNVKPQQSAHQERLMYEIDQTGENKCMLIMRWEKLRIGIPLSWN